MRRKVKPINGLTILAEGPAASQMGRSEHFLQPDSKAYKRLQYKHLCAVKHLRIPDGRAGSGTRGIRVVGAALIRHPQAFRPMSEAPPID